LLSLLQALGALRHHRCGGTLFSTLERSAPISSSLIFG
jgi:hypothetical protein